MKRGWNLARGGWLAVLSFGVAMRLAADTPVEIVNAGFEQAEANGRATAWTAHPNWRVEAGAGHNGSGGLVYDCATKEERRGGRPSQRIQLKPGRRYAFSVLAKAEDIATDRDSSYMGLTILVSGYDANDKWLFDAMARPCARGKGKDWVKLEGLTRKIPDELAYALVQPHAPQALGRGVMDDFHVAEAEEKPVERVYASTYRSEAAEGTVSFHAAINLDRERKPDDYSATFHYAAANGKPASVRGRIASAEEAAVELDAAKLAHGTHDVVCVLSLAGKEVGRAAAPFTRAKAPPRRRVTFDAAHRTLVDGKPFFPLGMYMSKVTASNLAIYAEAPFNVVMPYLPDEDTLDLCHGRGLKVIFNLQKGMNNPDAGKAWVEERVAKFRDHPALLAWYTNDERPLSDIPKLTARQRWVEALDPDHPTWSVQDRVVECRSYMPTCDVLGLDPYPISEHPIETVIDTIRKGRANTFGIRPVWMVPQAFGWNWLHRTTGQKQLAPTRAQLENMVWQCLAGGANGLVFYAFHQLIQPHSTCNNADEFTWADLCAIARDVKRHEPILLSDEGRLEASGAPAAIATRSWRRGDDVYLLVVNCTERPQKAALRLSRPFRSCAAANGGALPKLSGTTLEVDFAPLVHTMLRLR